jgi:hypothetical protein
MDPRSLVAAPADFEILCANGAVLKLAAPELASRSEFFAALVRGPTAAMEDARIVRARGDPEHVAVLVSYLAKGRLPSLLCVQDAIDVLELADFYGAETLASHCTSWLQYNVTEETALRVLVAVTRIPVREKSRAATRAATLLGRALGVEMHTADFLNLDARTVEGVLCHAAMVPFAKQMRLYAWLKWAERDARTLPRAATVGLAGLPVPVVGAILQRADVSREVISAIGAGLGVEPQIGMRSNEIDFALLIFDVSGRVFAVDLRTREAHELPPIPRGEWGKAVQAVYDHETGTAFVFGLDGRVDPYEYFPESGFSRRIAPPAEEKKNAAYVCRDGHVYCIGGSTAEQECTSTVSRMRASDGGRWKECTPMLAPRSSLGAAIVYGRKGAHIVAVGGTESRRWPPVERMDPASGAWSECEVSAPQMYARSVAVVEGDAYVVGGYSHEGRGACVLDVDCGTWRSVDEIANAPGQRAVAVEDGDTKQVWVFEACAAEGRNVQIYDTVTRAREDLRITEYTRGAAVVFVSRAAPGR